MIPNYIKNSNVFSEIYFQHPFWLIDISFEGNIDVLKIFSIPRLA